MIISRGILVLSWSGPFSLSHNPDNPRRYFFIPSASRRVSSTTILRDRRPFERRDSFERAQFLVLVMS